MYVCSNAALSSLECLSYAHGHGVPWDEGTCNFAALIACAMPTSTVSPGMRRRAGTQRKEIRLIARCMLMSMAARGTRQFAALLQSMKQLDDSSMPMTTATPGMQQSY